MLIKFMNLFKLNIKNSVVVIFLLFLFLHIALFNINVAEWGDSYRILRAAEYIRAFSYPQDEKRPPLFSALLAVRPDTVDQVLWGKLIMFVISVVSFWVFYKLCRELLPDNTRAVTLAMLLFTLNPVYFYWSLRLYADVPLTLLILFAFYLLTKWRQSLTVKRLLALGFVTGLAVLTRFEGYLLFISLAVGIPFLVKAVTKEKIQKVFWFALAFVLTLLPYLYFRNPLTSAYFEEPAGRKYDLETVIIYVLSLIFMYGFVFASYFILKYKTLATGFFKEHAGIGVYVLLNLLLVLLWPAAVPRLFVSGIPFLIVVLSLGLSAHFTFNQKLSARDVIFLAVVFGIYFIGQTKFRLQFLVPNTKILIFMLAVQAVLVIFIVLKKFKLFIAALIVALVVWAVSTVFLHKNVYTSLKLAADYAQQNLEGNVLYNDSSSISDWYLNQKAKNDKISGVYSDFNNKQILTLDYLTANNIGYLLITNEHNPSLDINLAKRPYLQVIQDFQYIHGGKTFFTKVVKVSK